MATKMSNPYVFSTSDRGKTYTRNMHGLESLCACFAEADIFFYQGLCSVQFPSCLISRRTQTSSSHCVDAAKAPRPPHCFENIPTARQDLAVSLRRPGRAYIGGGLGGTNDRGAFQRKVTY